MHRATHTKKWMAIGVGSRKVQDQDQSEQESTQTIPEKLKNLEGE